MGGAVPSRGPSVAHACRPLVFKQDVYDLMPLEYLNAEGPAVIQQQLIEDGTPHLVGVRAIRVGLAEIPAPGLILLAPDHGGAKLGEETCGFHVGQDAQLFEDGQAGGEEGFADVVTRKKLAFKKQHPPALAGQHGGGGTAAGAAADDEHVGAEVRLISHRQSRYANQSATCSAALPGISVCRFSASSFAAFGWPVAGSTSKGPGSSSSSAISLTAGMTS